MTALELPRDCKIVDAIYAYHEQRGKSEKPRWYLGMSEIGGVCERRLWYSYRGMCKRDFSGRMMRLFETGQLAEARFIKELRAIGCEVHDVDENGNQFELVALDGQFRGHMDGCATNTPGREKSWVGLEFKTHNSKSFAKLIKDGVAKAKPQHFCQCQCYMGVSGLRKFLYLASNKDDDSLYSEIIRYDQAAFDALMDRAWHVINDTEPPERISTRQDYFECSWCDARGICWNPLLQTASELFGAVPTRCSNDTILERYAEDVSRVVWKGALGLLRVEWQRRYDGEDIQAIEPVDDGDGINYRAAEFPGGRAVIVWTEMHQIGASNCEIREIIE